MASSSRAPRARRARRGPPELPPDTDIRAWLLAVPPHVREEAVRELGMTDADAFDGDWTSWAHDGQHPPSGDWNVWVVKGGRGFGKTLTGAKWVEAAVAAAPGPIRIALVGATLAEARALMVEGRSGLLEVAGPSIREWRPSLGLLRFRTGAVATLFSGHSPELLRGPEHHLAWCDELAKWEKAQETWDMLQLGLRLGDHPRVLVTTTPRPGPVLSGIMARPGCVTTGGPTSANPHLARAFLDNVHALYAGTRLGRQELDGELLPDVPGALWTVELLARCRAQGRDCGAIASQRVEPSSDGQPAARSDDRTDVTDSLRDVPTPTVRPEVVEGHSCFFPDESTTFVRCVIGVDPPTADGTCGIIACARDSSGRAHVLADHSVTARTPEGWSGAVAHAARIWSSPAFAGEGDHAQHGGGGPLPVTVVAESNQGGQMVRAVLHTADPSLRVKLVPAIAGKADRAAPVAMLFEAGKVALHGRFPELEAELCGLIAGGGYQGPGKSPDRADAMVWALTELMLTPDRAMPRVTLL
jgi:phage terminase large subunit-like protein